MSRTAKVTILLTARDLASRTVGGVVGAFRGLKNAVFSLQGAFAGLAASAVLGFLVKVNAEAQTLVQRLRTFEGSEAGARKVFQQLAKFADTTPFELNEVTEAYVTLRTAGIKPTEESLRLFGDHAAAMGVTMGELATAIRAATTGEMEPMKRMGVIFRQQGEHIQATFQGVTTTIGRDAQSITRYLETLSRQNFAGGMERQAKTIAGLWSTFKDTLAKLARLIGEAGFNDAVAKVVTSLTTLVNALAQNDAPLRRWITAITDNFRVFGASMGQIGAWMDVVRAKWGLLTADLTKAGAWSAASRRVDDAKKALEDANRNADRAVAQRARNWRTGGVDVAGSSDSLSVLAAAGGTPGRGSGADGGMARTGGSTASTTNFGEGKVKSASEKLVDDLKESVDLKARLIAINVRAAESAQQLLVVEERIRTALAGQTLSAEQRVELEEALHKAREARGGAAALGVRDALGQQLVGAAALGIPIGMGPAGGAPGGDQRSFGEKIGQAMRDAFKEGERLDSLIADMTAGTLREFGSAIEGAMAAFVSGSADAGQAFAGAMLGALAAVANGFGQFALGKAAIAIGDALMGDPRGWAAAAKYTGAATLLFALAGSIRGASAGGGGGGDGRTGARRDGADLDGTRGEATLIVEGGFLDMGDPRQEQALARALEQLSGRRVKVTRG